MALPEYNGWTNYQTWNVHLWITNDQGTDSMVRELATSADNETIAAEQLRDLVMDEWNPLADGASMFTDILTHALQGVNWYEIAAALREE